MATIAFYQLGSGQFTKTIWFERPSCPQYGWIPYVQQVAPPAGPQTVQALDVQDIADSILVSKTGTAISLNLSDSLDIADGNSYSKQIQTSDTQDISDAIALSKTGNQELNISDQLDISDSAEIQGPPTSSTPAILISQRGSGKFVELRWFDRPALPQLGWLPYVAPPQADGGTIVTRELSDNLHVADGDSYLDHIQILPFEQQDVRDLATISTTGDRQVSATDQLDISDQVFSLRSIVLQDQVTLTDAILLGIPGTQITERLDISEDVSKKILATHADTEIITELPTTFIWELIISELGQTLSDQTNQSVNIRRVSAFDNLDIADSLRSIHGSILSDSQAVSDSITVGTTGIVQLTLTESVSISDTTINKVSATIAEQVTLLDTSLLSRFVNLTISDELDISDLREVTLTRTVIDNVLLTDLHQASRTLELSDSLTVVDSIAGVPTLITLEDSLLLSDSIDTVRNRYLLARAAFRWDGGVLNWDGTGLFWDAEEEESELALQDSVNVSLAAITSLIISDSFNISDAIIKTIHSVESDNENISDGTQATQSHLLSDSQATSDQIVLERRLLQEDQLGLTDQALRSHSKLFADSYPITDSLIKDQYQALSLSDSLDISDRLGFLRRSIIHDTIISEDSTIASLERFFSERLTISDTISPDITAPQSGADSQDRQAVSDQLQFFRTLNITDQFPLIENVAVSLPIWRRSAIDDVFISDVATRIRLIAPPPPPPPKTLVVTPNAYITRQAVTKTQVYYFDNTGLQQTFDKNRRPRYKFEIILEPLRVDEAEYLESFHALHQGGRPFLFAGKPWDRMETFVLVAEGSSGTRQVYLPNRHVVPGSIALQTLNQVTLAASTWLPSSANGWPYSVNSATGQITFADSSNTIPNSGHDVLAKWYCHYRVVFDPDRLTVTAVPGHSRRADFTLVEI